MTQYQPANQRAEEAILGALMRSPDARLAILGGELEPEHFFFKPYRLIFEEITERYYSDDTIEPISVAAAVGPHVAKLWEIEQAEAIDRVIELTKINSSEDASAVECSKIIKRQSDYRSLLSIASKAVDGALSQQLDPEVIAGQLSSAATNVVTGSLLNSELLSYADLGRRWTRAEQEEIAAKAAGQDLGAFFGIRGVDDFCQGQRPTELMILAADPGSGKSAIGWTMARNFALRQMKKPPERRVGTLILSLEMGEFMSSTRLAQMEAKTEGEKLRLASISRSELKYIAGQWAKNRDLPIYMNFSGELRQSQAKALIVDGIRRHNVGLVVIDHLRFLKTDHRYEKSTEADDEIIRFLKATLAKDLNLVVVVLAHLTKTTESRRPVLNDLRGSGMISAFADLIAFVYHPWKHANEKKREQGLVAREDFELIWEKCRSSSTGIGDLTIDFSTMSVR